MLKGKFISYFPLGIIVLEILCCVSAPVASFAKDDYVYDIGGKRDPFIPLITADGRFLQLERTQEDIDASALKLEGIIYDKYGLSYAIVDGSVVKIGDIIADYQVLKIEEKRVIFIKY